jgi:hydroxymethylbilane synthase
VKSITIGSRKSPLALTQTEYVKSLLLALKPDLEVRVEKIVTSGDKILDSPLSRIGDRGLFVKEIEDALLEGRVDLAVHSAKDVPTELPRGLGLLAFPPREDTADVFVGPLSRWEDLGPDRKIGTSSLRRRSQLLAAFPGLEIVDIRGNVDTRIKKVNDLGLDGTVLAAAGLRRLGRFDEVAGFVIPAEVMVSAVGQGALAIEGRLEDGGVRSLLERLDHPATRLAVLAERAFMQAMEGGCQVPIGAKAALEQESLVLTAFVGTVAGDRHLRMTQAGGAAEPEELGRRLAQEMKAAGADEILAEVREGCGPCPASTN